MKLKLKKEQYPGKLIVFEGTDGAGKTTMINLSQKYLSELYGKENVLVTKTPTDMSRNTKLFQKMMYCKKHDDIDYRAVQLLTMSDRIQHTFEKIIPALQSGKFVLCDRYIYTSLVNMLARGFRNEKWFFYAAENLLQPDIVFLAYVKPHLAVKRIKERPEEVRRHLDESQLTKVAAGFLKMAKSENFVILNTSKNADEAFLNIKEGIDELIDAKGRTIA